MSALTAARTGKNGSLFEAGSVTCSPLDGSRAARGWNDQMSEGRSLGPLRASTLRSIHDAIELLDHSEYPSRVSRRTSNIEYDAHVLQQDLAASVPARAPTEPPETGTSSQLMPASSHRRFAISRVVGGCIVELSSSRLARPLAEAMPFGPKTAASRALASVTQVQTMSHRRATSAGDPAAIAP